ncbi:hypothetical protein OIU78_008544 [Salix suchowensis]|nr:hypothetical protein OIU78_008544 [Salix suchowensis]
MHPSFTLMIQTVQKGEANCHRTTFTGIYEKALSEDDRSAMNNGIHILSGNMKKFAFSNETVVDAADYGHSRNQEEHQILSPVPRQSYQDSSLVFLTSDEKLH